MSLADTLPQENRPAWGRGVLASYVGMTPRDEQNRRATDASKLTFPLQMVIVIVGGFLSITGAFWVSTSQIRSDVRDMATQQHDEQRIRDVERKLADERYETMRKAISDLTASQRLEEIRNQEMRIAIAALGGVKK